MTSLIKQSLITALRRGECPKVLSVTLGYPEHKIRGLIAVDKTRRVTSAVKSVTKLIPVDTSITEEPKKDPYLLLNQAMSLMQEAILLLTKERG